MAAHIRVLAIVYGLAAASVAVGAGFAIGALYMYLAGEIGPIWAALVLSGAFVLLALCLHLGVRLSARRSRRRAVARRRSSEAGAFATTAAISAIPMLLRSPLIVKLGVPAAAIAALAYLSSRDDPDVT